MHYTGITFRPPFEEKSLLLQVTTGCSHNACTFCSMYRDVPFRVSPAEEVDADIAQIARYRTLFKRVFLTGGDPFALSGRRLAELAQNIRSQLPRIESIGCYATIGNIATKTDDELRELAELGFSNLNIGLESGSDDVLAFMNKGYTSAEAQQQMQRLNRAGLSYSVNIIIGAAGTGRTAEHARECASLVNAVQPSMVFVSPLHLDPGAPLVELADTSRFAQCTLREYITEQIEFIRALELQDSFFFGIHEANPVRVSGNLPQDKEFLIHELELGIGRFPEWQLEQVPRQIASKPRKTGARTF